MLHKTLPLGVCLPLRIPVYLVLPSGARSPVTRPVYFSATLTVPAAQGQLLVKDENTRDHRPLSKACHQRCCECDLLFVLPPLSGNQAAYCPRCNAKVVSGRDWSMTRLTAMAIAMLLLMPFAFTEPLISIRLLGTRIDASLLEGIWQMSRQGDPLTASMVAFCTLGAR